MKLMATVIVLFGSVLSFAQTTLEERIQTRPGQKVNMSFKYPGLIKVKTGDQNEILIKANVSLNMGNNDDAFQLLNEEADGELEIRSEIHDYDLLPRYSIVKFQDKEYYFDGGWEDPDLKKFLDEHRGENISWITSGVAKDITLEITIPENIELNIYSRHGLIEIEDLPEKLTARSRHGGLDLSVPRNGNYNFRLMTRYGEILTNLDLEMERGSKEHKWTHIEAMLNGGGRQTILESRHGNIYLRAKN